jgi:hypothetical protein
MDIHQTKIIGNSTSLFLFVAPPLNLKTYRRIQENDQLQVTKNSRPKWQSLSYRLNFLAQVIEIFKDQKQKLLKTCDNFQ